ncbi:hypothetical protein PTTG_26371 [Puccinia triticina 1-1 BBBD Race 1]|uniref:Uncharacterized protein n=1 Tax=Puccinia triticina (isolate 1-1 / race 1 (BBBD)) TaxID=630390 RepID=A0A180GV34_PUCT1|nr:hypothetical protein PTTG_26371 [Puccinia triticina 1-1 BBBD Race 1]
MLFRFLVVALVCSNSYVWGMPHIAAINDIGQVNKIDEAPRFPFMAVRPFNHDQLEVKFSKEEPIPNHGVKTINLDLKAVCAAIRKEEGGKLAAAQLETIARDTMFDQDLLPVDSPFPGNRNHWMRWSSRYSFTTYDGKTFPEIARLVNKVCTQQINAQLPPQ